MKNKLKFCSLGLITLILMSFTFSETITIYGTQSARYTSNTSSSCCTPHSLHSYNQSSMYTSGCWWHDVYEQCFENRNTAIWRFDLSNLPEMQSFNAQFKYDMSWCEYRGYIKTSNETGAISTDLAYNLWHNSDWDQSLYDNLECSGGTHTAVIPQSQISYGSQSGQLNILMSSTDGYIDNTGLDAPRIVIEYEPFECNDQVTQDNCELDENCQWIEDIEWDHCGNYNNSNSCSNAHPDCYWDLCYGGNYGDWYHCCRGGSFQNDNSYCDELNAAYARFAFGNITSNMMEIIYFSESDIGGFQFNLEDETNLITITDVNGGLSEEVGFTLSFNNETGIIIGFSFEGETIPEGTGLLTNIYYTYNESGSADLCMTDIIVSDPNGQSLTTAGDCIQISGGVLGDLNSDNTINISDVIILVNLIISDEPIDSNMADINQDESINVLDVIELVNIILQ